MFKHEWFSVSQIAPETYAISEWGHWEKVHSFLLIGQEKAALIDTGLGIANIKEITDQLTQLPVSVLTTHVHTDHIGSHAAFEDIYVHEADGDWLSHGIEGRTLNQIRVDLTRDLTSDLPANFDSEKFVPFEGEASGYLRDGQLFDLGSRQLKILHTPGHSPGHIAIWDSQTQFLFTGDLLYSETPVYAFYPSTSPGDLVNSWEKISRLANVSEVYGSHNQLGLEAAILKDVAQAVDDLRQADVIRWGTGLHDFGKFSVKF